MSQRAIDVLVALRQIQRQIEMDARRLAQAAELTPSQLRVLQILDERGETSAGEIVIATQLSNATITSLVDKMVERGLVCRRRCDADRRRVWLTLQPAGRKALSVAPRCLQEAFERRFDTLAGWEQAMLVAALERITQLLEADSLDAAPILSPDAIEAKPQLD